MANTTPRIPKPTDLFTLEPVTLDEWNLLCHAVRQRVETCEANNSKVLARCYRKLLDKIETAEQVHR